MSAPAPPAMASVGVAIKSALIMYAVAGVISLLVVGLIKATHVVARRLSR